MTYQERLLKAIPGGAHTYSRGFDQFPSNAPQILESAKGAYVFSPDGRKFLDYGMGLRSVSIGYAEDEINRAAFEQIEKGNNLTRASIIELEAAELLIELIDSVDMVKFTKNGSTATTAAVKLARAYTGRELVARCAEHPFFSYDDWFIGSTDITRGIPEDTITKTLKFHYNDLASLENMIAEHPNQIACVIMEPATIEHPTNDFLKNARELCRRNGIVFILDEMITGFRWHIKGAQHYYGIEPDLCTFGKAMANGFSVAAIAGRREIMELGSIELEGRERLFLLSTTHGAEMAGMGAFVASVAFLKKYNVIEQLWEYGKKLINLINQTAQSLGIEKYFQALGVPCSPYYQTFDRDGKISMAMRTLFAQEMISNGVMIPWVALSYRHGDKELELTRIALERSLTVYKRALEEGISGYLKGEIIKPVFRKYN
ncbi:glutamate-1-semialdehyde 2,1-aminomutase [Geobacter sp. AOG1]|uniref:glutamate-1-semialdehyde 2,1-aminomutase n=1 Tax=Geobacter sp. AOG1 TaxID=1566346 RepID=UPI001CC3FF10|nr:glutamate-1-semialdehyde 2,1-aminomutase [Geobacter sp. AOG1]GFE58480.1 glutamate-1-semialdehyde 2,1-aminomutase [Geobacter sp. AOG1]